MLLFLLLWHSSVYPFIHLFHQHPCHVSGLFLDSYFTREQMKWSLSTVIRVASGDFVLRHYSDTCTNMRVSNTPHAHVQHSKQLRLQELSQPLRVSLEFARFLLILSVVYSKKKGLLCYCAYILSLSMCTIFVFVQFFFYIFDLYFWTQREHSIYYIFNHYHWKKLL